MKKECQERTVLIIEDEIDVRNFASRVLELEDYRVLRAETGEEGLELARRGGINLVLLDLRLPACDGWSVLEQIKGEPGLSEITVVVFTASAGTLQRMKALLMGATDYLVKPLSAAKLREAVNKAMDLEGMV